MIAVDDFDRLNISHYKLIEHAKKHGAYKIYIVKTRKQPPYIQDLETRITALKSIINQDIHIHIIENYNEVENVDGPILILEDKFDYMNIKNLEIIKLRKGEKGYIVNSHNIREGIVDRIGHDFSEMYKEYSRFLQYELRHHLKPPLGQLIKGKNQKRVIQEVIKKLREYNRVIAIGDVVTQTLIDEGFYPYLAVFDYKTKREKYDLSTNFENKIITYNPPAMILKETWAALDYGIRKKYMAIEVQGEEDLLVLPAIVLLENSDVVLYGQPNEGVVIVEINKKVKQFAREFINKMKKIED